MEEKSRLPQLNSVHVPEGIDEKEVRRRLLADYSLEIGAGLGDLAGKIWRFGLMGYSSRIENVMLCLGALETVLSDMGKKSRIRSGRSCGALRLCGQSITFARRERSVCQGSLTLRTGVRLSDGVPPGADNNRAGMRKKGNKAKVRSRCGLKLQSQPLPDGGRQSCRVQRVEMQPGRSGAEQPVA